MRRQSYLFLDTIVLGIVGALGARLFSFLLDTAQHLFLELLAGYSAPGLPNEGGTLQQVIGSHGLWLIPLAIVIGGIISGVLVYTWAPEAEGHGTDTAVNAFHNTDGKIRPRVTPIKILASAITIGSGGSAGREGPTALFSAGFGSIYASLTNRTDSERRLLVLIGMAAGLSAIFRSPIGTAIFAIEVLYRDMEFEGNALIYTMLGSIIAYTINGIFVGWQPLFQITGNIGISNASDYLLYVVLGLASGVIGALVPNIFYSVRDFFHKIPIPPHFKPAIGGLIVGLIAYAYPQVLGGGYGWMQMAINGQLAISVLIALLFLKMIAFAFTVSSGGSGGVFAPTLFVGAMLGGILAIVFNQPSAAFVVVGMAAVFGSAARVPIATLLMVTEMTGGYQLLVPAALAVMIGYLLQEKLTIRLKYKSLYEAQVNRRSDSPAHRLDHIRTAVKLLSEKKAFDPETIGNLDFVSLLQSNIPIELPDGKHLFLGNLKKKSPCVNTKIKDNCLVENNDEWEIVAIIRDEQLILPHPNTKLEAEDQLLIFAEPDKINILKSQLENSKIKHRNKH